MNIEAVGGSREFPPGLPLHNLSQEAVPVPPILKLPIVLVPIALPIHVTIINQPEPLFLDHLGPGPLDVVKHRIVVFQPEEPHHRPMQSHPDVSNLVITAGDPCGEDPLLPVERAPGPSLAIVSGDPVKNKDTPLPRKLRSWALPKAM
jgi:hypothetical protein